MYEAKIIDVWAVHQGDDDRQNGYPAFFFSSHEDASKYAKNSGWYGGKAPITKRQAVAISNGEVFLLDTCKQPIDLDQKQAKHLDQVRMQAMAKLTVEEQMALFGDVEDVCPKKKP